MDAEDVLIDLVREALGVLWTIEIPQDERIATVLAKPAPWDVAGITTLLSVLDPLDLSPALDATSPYEPAARSILASVPPSPGWSRTSVEESLWAGLAVVSPERPKDRARFEKLRAHLYASYRAACKR